MITVITVRAGMTTPLDFQFTGTDPTTGLTNPLDLTGITNLEFHIQDYTGIVTDFIGAKMTVTDARNGKIRFSPASTDLVYSRFPYNAWFKFTDSSGFVNSVPSDSNLSLQIMQNY